MHGADTGVRQSLTKGLSWSWTWSAVTAVGPPPAPGSEVELGLQWLQSDPPPQDQKMNLVCSDCSRTPPIFLIFNIRTWYDEIMLKLCLLFGNLHYLEFWLIYLNVSRASYTCEMFAHTSRKLFQVFFIIIYERVIGRGVCCLVFNVFGILVFWLLIVLI